MKKYRYIEQGTFLGNSEGRVISLPIIPGSPSISSEYKQLNVGLTVLFPYLGVTRWLLRDAAFRSILNADNSMTLVLSGNADAQRTMLISAADLAAAGFVAGELLQFYFAPDPLLTTGTYQQWYINVYLNGNLLPQTQVSAFQSGQPDIAPYTYTIGGSSAVIKADFNVYEYFKHSAPAMTAAQFAAVLNRGRGADVQSLRFLGRGLVHLARFSSTTYNTPGKEFIPIVATGTFDGPYALLSTTYREEYDTTTALFFDGASGPTVDPERLTRADRVDLASGNGLLPTSCDNFTYEVDVRPNKTLANIVAEGEGDGLVGFNDNDGPGVLPGNWNLLQSAFQYTPYMAIGTNGVLFGLAGLTNFYNRTFVTLLSYQGNLTPADAVNGFTHVAVVMRNRHPELYINRQLVHTGIAPPEQPGAFVPTEQWPIFPVLQFGEAAFGFNSSTRGGTYGGWARNWRVWSQARPVDELTDPGDPEPTAASPGLELYWPMSRPTQDAATLQDVSANGRTGQLTNYTLVPLSPTYRFRAGKLIF